MGTTWDFTGGSLPAGATLTRASAKTRRASSGLIASVTTNVAAFEYVSGVCVGISIEPARTNTHDYSWTPNSWGKPHCYYDGTITSPDGTANAVKFHADAGSYGWLIENDTGSASSGVVKTATYRIKYGNHQWIWIGGDYAGGSRPWAAYDVLNGVKGNTVNGTTITDYTCVLEEDGFAVLTFSMAPTSSGAGDYRLIQFGSGPTPTNANVTLTGAEYAYIVAGQAEIGAKRTSDIVTSGTTDVTRAADVLSITVPSGATQLLYTFSDATTQTVSVSSGAYNVPTNLNRRIIASIVSNEGGGSTLSGAGASAGVGVLTATGQAVKQGVAASAGVSTASAVGGSTKAGAGASAGASTASAAGIGIRSAIGSAAGVSAASAVSSAIASAAGASAGSSGASASGVGVSSSVGSAAGLASATAQGRSTASAVASASGSAAVVAQGLTIASGSGTGVSSGTSGVQATGTATAASVGGSSGASTATAAGARTIAATASSTGAAGTAAVGGKIIAAVGASAGASAVAGASSASSIGAGAGASAGAAGVTASATAIKLAAGSISGLAAVAGAGASTQSIAAGVGSSAGFSTSAANANGIAAATGSSSGASAAAAAGQVQATVSGVGASAGVSVLSGLTYNRRFVSFGFQAPAGGVHRTVNVSGARRPSNLSTAVRHGDSTCDTPRRNPG